MADQEPIIIFKRKGGHAGHHGGAWKVAYADFVTALMALFIVLWLLSTSKPTQEAVGGYFRDPNGTATKKGADLPLPGGNMSLKKDDMSKVKDDLLNALKKMKDFQKIKDHIEITVTSEGVRVELIEDANTFFESGSAHPTPALQELLKALAGVIGKLPNNVSIEGHTDSTPYSDSKSYGNWELSTDRANTGRRLMQISGVRADQVKQVRGFADQKLRKPLDPTAPANRRISVIVQNSDATEAKTVDGTGLGESPARLPTGKDAQSGKPPAGKELAGKTSAGKEAAGKEPGLKEPAPIKAAAKETTPKETAPKEAPKETAAREPLSKESVTKQGHGQESTGKQSAGKEADARGPAKETGSRQPVAKEPVVTKDSE